jgi:hypothetical protein
VILPAQALQGFGSCAFHKTNFGICFIPRVTSSKNVSPCLSSNQSVIFQP